MRSCEYYLQYSPALDGFTDDSFRLGSLFNAAQTHTLKQAYLAKVISEKYPRGWEELEKIGLKTTPEEYRVFDIDREVLP